jgi:FtsZ-binding cell division protein ZapB
MHPTAKPAEDLFHCKSPVENVISSFSGYFREENQPLNQEQESWRQRIKSFAYK